MWRLHVPPLCLQFGFIDYDIGEGKKLFFHVSEVVDGVEIAPGHEVEFVIVQNQKNGRYSAVNVRRLTWVVLDKLIF